MEAIKVTVLYESNTKQVRYLENYQNCGVNVNNVASLIMTRQTFNLVKPSGSSYSLDKRWTPTGMVQSVDAETITLGDDGLEISLVEDPPAEQGVPFEDG